MDHASPVKWARHRTNAQPKKATRNLNTTTVEIPIEHPAIDDPCNEDEDELPIGLAQQHFHIDFGFVRGSRYSINQEDQPTVTNIDGYSSYLIAVDCITRYVWIFLTFSKAPPITIAKTLLEKFKCNNPHRSVRTDQGGETWPISRISEYARRSRIRVRNNWSRLIGTECDSWKPQQIPC